MRAVQVDHTLNQAWRQRRLGADNVGHDSSPEANDVLENAAAYDNSPKNAASRRFKSNLGSMNS